MVLSNHLALPRMPRAEANRLTSIINKPKVYYAPGLLNFLNVYVVHRFLLLYSIATLILFIAIFFWRG